MSNVAGMFSGALMTLSLLAVPCMAVFGLPTGGQVVTDADAKAGVTLGDPNSLGAAPYQSTAPAFAPMVDAAPPAVTDEVVEPHLDRTSDRRGAAANSPLEIEESPRAHAATTLADSRTAMADSAAVQPADSVPAHAERGDASSPSTCDGIAKRLNTLGVVDLRFTSDSEAGQFYCTCSVKEAEMTRRFEAEASTSVAAAEDVLAQVEQCIGTR